MPDVNEPSTGRVLVLGGQGVLGTAIAVAFGAAGWTSVRAGRRPDSGADFRLVDLDEPDTLEQALDGIDLIVSTVPDERLVAERMVLSRGGVLINVSAMAASAVQRLRRVPGEPRGTVLMNAGIAPGLTNLLAADLLADHPEADEVELVFTVSAKSAVGPAGSRFAHRALTRETRHQTTVVALPEPFGRRRCLGFAEADNGWLGAVADGRAVSPYLCISEHRVHSALLAFNSAGIIARLPRSAFAGAAGSAGGRPGRSGPSRSRTGSRSAAAAPAWPRAPCAAAATTGRRRRARCCSPVPWRPAPGPGAGVLVPEEAFTIGELRSALAESDIVVVDEQ